eukprot:5166074-Pyramimonas_sp.AAC.1
MSAAAAETVPHRNLKHDRGALANFWASVGSNSSKTRRKIPRCPSSRRKATKWFKSPKKASHHSMPLNTVLRMRSQT